MVSALVSGSSVQGLSPGEDIALCSWASHFTLTVPLSTHVYTGVLNSGGKSRYRLASQPGGNRNTPSCFMLQSQLRPNGPLDSYVDFTHCGHSSNCI